MGYDLEKVSAHFKKNSKNLMHLVKKLREKDSELGIPQAIQIVWDNEKVAEPFEGELTAIVYDVFDNEL